MSDPRAGYVKKASGLQDKVDRFIADDKMVNIAQEVLVC